MGLLYLFNRGTKQGRWVSARDGSGRGYDPANKRITRTGLLSPRRRHDLTLRQREFAISDDCDVKFIKYITAEAWLAGGLALFGIFGFVFMSQLVAEPKVLFGRSLTAIPPSLFPALVLGTMAILAGLLLYSLRVSLLAEHSKTFEDGALHQVVMLFAVMFFYALTMAPLGFFISSALSMAAVAWIAGNRSIFQICAVSIVCPIGLYLVSTRGLAVSLPELSSIEFLYARVFEASSGVLVDSAGSSQ